MIMKKKVLVVGSGGREHAIVKALKRSDKVGQIYCAPGNAGIAEDAECVAIGAEDIEALVNFAQRHNIDLTVVGPEASLAAGIADAMKGVGLKVFGPTKSATRIESSKEFAKQIMEKYNVPTASYKSFDNYEQAHNYVHSLPLPIVIKYDGLAAGKGVVIANTYDEADEALRSMLLDSAFGDGRVIIEDFLEGPEFSFMCLVNGDKVYPLEVAQDHKRAFDGDKGPNTGGMGAVSPVIFADESFMRKVIDRIIEPTVKGLKEDGIDYRGFIFFGLINVGGEPMVIEYNCRMGDPETEAVMPRIDGDLVNAMVAAAKGDLSGTELCVSPMACTAVIAVSEGYPGSYKKGYEITLPEHTPEGVEIFQAGTKLQGDKLVTSGGRVLAVSSLSHDIEDALSKCYDMLKHINYQGITFRKDIGRDLMSLKR